MISRAPIAISYRPKAQDYLPVVVASIRHHLGDWPISLLTESASLPPNKWLENNRIQAITDWEHSAGANKILRLWEHQEIFARHHERWIWWHDDMLLLRQLENPEHEFSRPLVRHGQRKRPNKELNNWHLWLWDTLGFFRCLSVAAPNPVLHTPRLIERACLAEIPAQWNRKRLLFEPTYLLWKWHRRGMRTEIAENFRECCFEGEIPSLQELEATGSTIFNWGRHIDHAAAARVFSRRYPLAFE